MHKLKDFEIGTLLHYNVTMCQGPVTGPKYVLAQALISQIPNFSSLKKWLFISHVCFKFSRLQTLYSDLQVVFGELKGVFGEIVYEIADNLDLKPENYLWGFKVGTNIILYNVKKSADFSGSRTTYLTLIS